MTDDLRRRLAEYGMRETPSGTLVLEPVNGSPRLELAVLDGAIYLDAGRGRLETPDAERVAAWHAQSSPIVDWARAKGYRPWTLRRQRMQVDGEDVVVIRGEDAPDDGLAVELPGAGWDYAQQGRCPDCAGQWVWWEAGYVPGTRKCLDCGSFFTVGPPREND